MDYDEMLRLPPFGLGKREKEKVLTKRLVELTQFHRKHCLAYERIMNSICYEKTNVSTYEDLPFLPVKLFKELELRSISQEDIFKIMTSSGTTGQAVSKIYLDQKTASIQQKTLVKIVSSFTGTARIPMLIIDSPSAIKDRNMFTARGAGILGFSIFGSDKTYALNDKMELDVVSVENFLSRHPEQRILLFGFTFMVWQHFYRELVRLRAAGKRFDFSHGFLIHGGGWKKLVSESVSHDEFSRRLNDVCGLDQIHDYYGMVEQTGCIYMECEHNYLHASIFSDVIIRRGIDFSLCEFGEKGIIQVVSALPESYPGHSLITEDEGIILGEDDCPCGRKGKYFKVIGRLNNAEIRGCSDTYAT